MLRHPLLEEFFNHPQCEGPEATDMNGRFLLPMDYVCYNHRVDSPVHPSMHVAIHGKVANTWKINGNWYVKCVAAPQFVEMGFDPETINKSDVVCRMPTCGSLVEFLYCKAIADINMDAAMRFGPLTVNGKGLFFYA